jgi:hypothetical protein
MLRFFAYPSIPNLLFQLKCLAIVSEHEFKFIAASCRLKTLVSIIKKSFSFGRKFALRPEV